MSLDQEELVVTCYFVGLQTRRLEEARFVLINRNCCFLFNVLIRIFPHESNFLFADLISRNRLKELLFVLEEIGRDSSLCLMHVLSQGKQKVTLEDETKFLKSYENKIVPSSL